VIWGGGVMLAEGLECLLADVSWYEKRPGVTEEVVSALGGDVVLWQIISEKVHFDDLWMIREILKVSREDLVGVLYRPCDAPGGVCFGVC